MTTILELITVAIIVLLIISGIWWMNYSHSIEWALNEQQKCESLGLVGEIESYKNIHVNYLYKVKCIQK